MFESRLSHFFRTTWLACGLVLLASFSNSAQAQTGDEPGFALTAAGILVDQAEQWAQWTRPKHAVSIDPLTNGIGPRRVQKETNAIADIDRYQIKIGDLKALEKLQKELNREGRVEPLNIRTAPASVAGVPIVYLKANSKTGVEIGDPIIWYFYHGGIRAAPTNTESAANIIDGDPQTYWEPGTQVSKEDYDALPEGQRGPIEYFAPDTEGLERRTDLVGYEEADRNQRRIEYHTRSLSNRFIDIELGRLVPVSRIVLRFAEEGVGEPFRQFRILGTPSHSRDASLSLIARTNTPNENERVVEFDLDPDLEDDEQSYQQLHLIRIALTDSKFDKFVPVSAEEYFAMPVADQGGIDYFINNAVGSETQVEKAIYDQVGPERQGRLVYYQRERPRLAEVEVWSQGDNIGLDIIDGGGSIDLTGRFGADAGFDGLFESNFLQLIWSPDPRFKDRGVLTMDMGATFWVDQFRMVGGISGVDELVTRFSDGGRDSNGNLKWTEVDRQQGGTIDKILEKPVQTRFLTTQIFSEASGRAGGYNTGDRIREFQLFGAGYPSEVTLTSPMIEMPGTVILGDIEWDADIPDSNLVEVEVRTRTGDRLIEVTEYYGSGGEFKTQEDYDKLPTSFQGPIVTRKVPGGGWSSWSQKYLQPGDPITSPSPRRFAQIQVRLLSKSPEVAAQFRSVRVNFRPPVAHRSLAEVWPNNVPLGEDQDLQVYVKPTFVESQPNGEPSSRFDEILLDASPIQAIELVEVGVGREEELEQDSGERFSQLGWRIDAASGERSYWFEDEAGPFQALISPMSGDTLKVFQGGIFGGDQTANAPQVLVRLPRKIEVLDAALGQRVFNRVILEEGDEVPVDADGRLLNELTYLSLALEEKGRIDYFQVVGSNADGPVQELVEDFEYKALDDSLKGEIRYFRRLIGRGGEFAFNRAGEVLDEAAYDRLSAAERGSIIAGGELVHLRFKGKVLLNGTTIDVAIRDSNAPETWQGVDGGDATGLSPGAALNISVPFSSRLVQDLVVGPNPFTPNEDGINDQATIRFAIGNLNQDRRIEVSIYDLGGRRMWMETKEGFGEQIFAWDGRDGQGAMVPPGLYLCHVEVDADSKGASQQTVQRLIAVAY
ncbi:MAG: hypothetical protein GKR89_29120 [Candidatus Latescibacteria bacterium]|nr:hypothetical protein [Candidatus Latescibacterota bacterium]